MSQLQIPFDTTDAKDFQVIVETIIHYLVTYFDPSEVSIIRIKNWFDHKWLNYSGKQLLEYDSKSNPEIPFVLEPYWNTEITIPPFHPNRVLSETKFRKKDINNTRFLVPFHQLQPSIENKKNVISRRLQNGLCFWISSNSTINHQGSLMVYEIKNGEVKSWHIGIEKKEVWKVTKTKGISKQQIESMLTFDSIS